MMQISLTADRHIAECVAPDPTDVVFTRGARPGLARTVLNLFRRDRTRDLTTDMLNDHLLQDIGVTRADLEALQL